MTSIRRNPPFDRTAAPGRHGRAWPVPAMSLDVLSDLGMSDDAIGRYFGVDAGTVRDARAAPQAAVRQQAAGGD